MSAQPEQPDMNGFVEDPQGPVHKRHECPPDRVAMLERLAELEKGWNQRLANQKNVINNLSDMTVAQGAQLGRVERLLATWENPDTPTSWHADAARLLRAAMEPREGDTP